MVGVFTSFRKVPVLIAFCVFALWPTEAYAVSGNVPLDSPVYEILDLLNAQGCLRTHLAGTRPVTYGEVFRLLDEVKDRCEVKSDPPDPAGGGNSDSARLTAAGQQDRTAKREVTKKTARAIARLEYLVLTSLKAGTGFSPVRDPELEIIYLDGDPSSIPVINASQSALIYNNEGIDPNEWTTGYLSFQSELFLGDLEAQLFPVLSLGEDDGQPLIHRAYVKVEALGFELGAGKESLWWGQGRHGGLYLTSNAEPLPMIRLTNANPLIMPWIFEHLGPFRLDFFLSRLEEDRAVPEPYFAGVRFNFRPSYMVELGATMMVITGGEGRPDVDLSDLFDIFFGENEIGGEDRSNKIAGFDFRFSLPGWQIYGEFGGEDESNGLPSRMAGLIGVYFPAVTESVDLTFEYVDLAYTQEIASAWYRHGIYTDGYTYEGRILGHHVGGGGRDFYSGLGFDLGQWAKLKFGFDIEQRGRHIMPVTEDHAQVIVGYEQYFGQQEDAWKGQFTAGLDKVRNVDYVAGEKEFNFYFSVAVSAPL